MRKVTEDEFVTFMFNHDYEIECEKDIEYAYDNYKTTSGQEIGFISYHSYKPTTYHIAD